MSDIVTELTPIITANSQSIKYVSMNRFIDTNNPIITPTPLYKIRQKERWFNQSELLAKSIAEKLQLECQLDLLVRTKFSKPQAGLNKKERLQNIKDSFIINRKALGASPDSEASGGRCQLATPSSVMLFDDVWTTGATMRECVNVLKRGGVKKVWCLTVAR